MPARATTPIAYADGARLGHALRAGCARLIAARNELNRINVYPVADGDTGSNLAATARAVDNALSEFADRRADTLLQAAADAALDNARGNSGTILAQYITGLADACAGRARLDARGLVAALHAAAGAAREALSQPVEGTVLSVMSAVGDAARRYVADGGTDIAELLVAARAAGRAALEKTRTQLEQMRRAGVADAGAAGFMHLVEGACELIESGSLRDLADEAPPATAAVEQHEALVPPGELTFRYCTECMVSGEAIGRAELRRRLEEMGDSLVLAGNVRRMRIHVHTDHPSRVFALAGEHGLVSALKADDMQRQSQVLGAGTGGIAIITDSGADLPDALMGEYGIHMVSLQVQFGEQAWLDRVGLTSDEFFELLASEAEHPGTSQPAPRDFQRNFEFLASHYRAVVGVSLSAALSGTHQGALAAAERVAGGERIHIVDSASVSVGQGLLALYAARRARAGDDAATIVAGIERMREKTHTFGLIPDLRYAVRGGRIRRPVAALTRLARARAILTMRDGRARPGGVVFRGGTAGFVRHVARKARRAQRYRVAVAHASCPDDAAALAEQLVEQLDVEGEVIITGMGPALGVHAGPGTLAAAIQEVDGRGQ